MLPKGTPVKIVGNTGQEANVIAANATDSFPAHLVLNQDLLAGASGEAVAIGFINNVSVPNASIFTGGQEVYLSPIGGWTTTRPTGAANIQLLGNIVKVNTGANTVSGIFAPQNIEYLPNLTQGKTWVGNSSGLAEEFDLISELNSRQIANTMQFLVASGTAQTIDWNNGGSINLDLSSASGNVTLTLQNPVSGAIYRIRVQQGATVRNLIFPASTVQPGGGGTTYTGIAGTDLLTVYYNGSAYMVQSALNSGFTLSAASIAAAYLALAGGTMAGNLNLPSLNGGQLAGMRNKIINGGCLVSQRGAVSVFNNTVTYGGADRIYGFVSGTTASATLQTLSVPVDNLSSTGVYQVLGPMTSTGTTTALLGQRIEAKNTGDLNSKTITVKANVYQDTGTTQTFAIRVMKGNAIDTFTAPVLIATSSGVSVPHATATPVTFTLTLGSSDANNGLQVDIISTTLPALTSKYIGIGDFQLEPGSVATPFEHRPYGAELALCQRYFFTNTLLGGAVGFLVLRTSTTGTFGGAFIVYPFPVSLRAIPSTVTVYSSSSRANPGRVLVNGGPSTSNLVLTTSSATCVQIWNNGALPNDGDYFQCFADVAAEL